MLPEEGISRSQYPCSSSQISVSGRTQPAPGAERFLLLAKTKAVKPNIAPWTTESADALSGQYTRELLTLALH
jgi:hypothetical protein